MDARNAYGTFPAMLHTTLISTDALAAGQNTEPVAVIDCRHSLEDPDWGRGEFETAHIPGAVFASIDADLSGAKTGTNGRHPLPDPAALVRTLGTLGIAKGMQVVAYDQDAGMYASRLWWLLRWLGHDAVAVLDGGFARWTSEGRPVASGPSHATPAPFSGTPRPDMIANADDVAARTRDSSYRVIDARAPERYRGEVEPIDKVAGHIPGAINHPFKTNLDARGSFRPTGELRHQFTNLLGDVPAARAICYCGSGVTACHNLLAMEHAGLFGAQLYPGSWSEWSSDSARPVARSDSET